MSKFRSDINYLRQYVNGELTSTEMYELERAMHEDQMLMDIIEGLETEKELKSAIPTTDLHAKIKKRTLKEHSTKLFSLKKLLVAASIIALISIGTWYYLYNNPSQDIIQNETLASAPQSQENDEEPVLTPDSSLIALSEQETVAEKNQVVQRKIETTKAPSSEVSVQKKLMVYEAKPKMQVVIEGPKYLNKDKAEVIEIASREELKPIQTELLSAKVGSAKPQVNTNSSIAKTQADLQRLDLDPQIKTNLTAVLSRQVQENRTELKEKKVESTISEVLIHGNAVSNKQSVDSKILTTNENYGTIANKPIQNGNPTTGWTKFNAYIKEELHKKGLNTYTANISFDLDTLMKPTLVVIKSSSNKKINQHIKEILKNGPTWENKDPNHPIFIRISSEEEKK